MSVEILSLHWNADFAQIRFSVAMSHQAIRLTLKSDPSVVLMVYELGNGLNIASAPDGTWTPNNPHTIYSGTVTDINRGFVEAHVNPALRTESMLTSKKRGARLCKLGQQSDATDEFFNTYLPLIKGMIKAGHRDTKVERMKDLIKDLGDLTEDEMLDLWRCARAEEVMSS